MAGLYSYLLGQQPSKIALCGRLPPRRERYHSSTSQPMKELVSELKRRNVFRVAVAYFVAAWLVTEVAMTVLPILEAPQWTPKLVLMLVALGFPIILIIAWVFEFTPGSLGSGRRQGRCCGQGDWQVIRSALAKW